MTVYKNYVSRSSGEDIDPDSPIDSRLNKINPISSGLVAAYKAAVIAAGDDLTSEQMNALTPAAEELLRSSAWPKLKELWIPLGSIKAGAYVKIKTAAGSLASIAEIGAATYTPSIGIIGDGAASRLNTGFNPTAAGCITNDWGYGVYHMPAPNTSNTGTLAGTTTGTTNYLSVDTGGVNINNTFVNSGATPLPRWNAAQVGGGLAQQWTNEKLMATLASSGAMPNIAFTLLSTAGAFFSNGRIGGWAAWSPSLTRSEMSDVTNFFDYVNAKLWRPVFGTSLVSVGDSNTLGLGVTATERWSYLLSVALELNNNSGAEFNNGINGSTIAIWNSTAANQYHFSVKRNPALMTMMIGTNDCGATVSTEVFRNTYISWLEKQIDSGISPDNIILISPIWGKNINGSYEVNKDKIPPYTAVVRDIAETYGTGFFDPYPITYANSLTWYQADNLHLNIAGHNGLYLAVLDYIKNRPVKKIVMAETGFSNA